MSQYLKEISRILLQIFLCTCGKGGGKGGRGAHCRGKSGGDTFRVDSSDTYVVPRYTFKLSQEYTLMLL